MTQPESPLDERVWQAWLRNNKAQDKMRLARRLRILGLVAMLLTVATLVWRLTG